MVFWGCFDDLSLAYAMVVENRWVRRRKKTTSQRRWMGWGGAARLLAVMAATMERGSGAEWHGGSRWIEKREREKKIDENQSHCMFTWRPPWVLVNEQQSVIPRQANLRFLHERVHGGERVVEGVTACADPNYILHLFLSRLWLRFDDTLCCWLVAPFAEICRVWRFFTCLVSGLCLNFLVESKFVGEIQKRKKILEHLTRYWCFKLCCSAREEILYK